MRILALDTATRGCSVAFRVDGSIVARRAEPMVRGQSEALLPMVQAVLADAGSGFDDLDLLAVTVGPGAFTGLRTGLAAARGMALAAGLPCLGVTTLEAVAAGAAGAAGDGESLLVALDSKRADFYVQVFDAAGTALDNPRAVLPEDLAAGLPPGPVAVVGDAADGAVAILGEAGLAVRRAAAPDLPDAAVVAALAAARWRPGATPAPPQPLYLRPPDAVRPKHGGRLRP